MAGDTSSLSTQQEITAAVISVPAAERIAKLKAAREFGLKDPRSNGQERERLATALAAGRASRSRLAEPGLNAAVVLLRPRRRREAPAGRARHAARDRIWCRIASRT